MGILIPSSLLFLFITSAICCSITMQYGNITQELDLLVDDMLTIQCSLFSSPIVYENNTYIVSSKDLRLKFEKDILEDTAIVNDLKIEYSVKNAQINDSGFYSCYVAIPDKNVLVCSTYIAVGYKPLPVENFSCISYEYTNLTCTWKKPFNPVHTDYKLWDYIRYETFQRKCPDILNETSCRWTMDTRPQYYRSAAKLHFIMIGNNSLGHIKQNMMLEHFKIVKPGIPREVMLFNVTEKSMVLRWSPPKHMEYGFTPGLQYSIQYQPLFKLDTKQITRFSDIVGLMHIGDLVPYTEYEFKVRCRSSVVDNDDFWSPTVTTSMGTEPDVPYLAPEMTPSSFDVENILGNRTITLYWKGIPSDYENGGNFHYVIQYHMHYVPLRMTRSEHQVHIGNKTAYTFPHMDTHSAYIFKIYAVNSIGPSANTSEIVIDKVDRLLEKPKDITVISYGQGKYNLSWKASNQRPFNFTLYWCKSLDPRPFKCEGPLEWLHTTKTKYILQLPDKTTNYQFAVSANDNGQTSGMSWASCIVYYKGVHYKVKKVEMTPKNATSLKIQWSLECEAQKIVMKEYAIEYCEFEGSCAQVHTTKSCSEWKTFYVSNVSNEDFVLGSLKPFTRYLAFVRVHTLSGWSINSNLACEMTMATAPSDPPGDVEIADIDGKVISVSFKPPQIPNGIISRFVVYYNKSDGTSYHQEFRTKELSLQGDAFNVNLVDSMSYYTNYSIEVAACVDQACSEKSEPVYAFTGISYPDSIAPPRIEVLNSLVNVSWNNPSFTNGPINYFQVLKESNSSKMQLFNVTGQNCLILSHNCTDNEEDKIVYHFRVRAVNIRNGVHLLGHYSQPTKTMLCPFDTPVGIIVGIVVGSTVGIIVLVLVIYSIVVWMKNEVDMIKGIQIQLPKDLECPMENPLSSYDKFKNGLQTNHDSGIPCDTSYERLCAFASDEVKDKNQNMEEKKRKSSGRNNSGESTASGKCHDSISSSNTTKTHLSIDSGAEVDSPPSPDGLFSDTSSSHTTPRSYKPDLTIVQESSGSNSKDSGLDRDGTCSFLSHNLDLPSKFSYFVRKRNFPYSNVQIPNGDARIPNYSKFAVLGSANVPSFIPYGEQSLGLLENSLSNSEPSVADFDVSNVSEPLVPYCKFGLARSAGNGLNISNQITVNNKIGYSKFGTVYRAVKRQNSGNIPTLHAGVHTCPKFLPHNPQTFTALTINNNPFSKHLPEKDNDRAYSKFGVSCPKKVPVNGYVTFRDTLTYPSAETSCANQAYSKLGMTASNKKPSKNEAEPVKENGVIINAAELQELPMSSRTSYVSFRNVKGMNLSDSLGKEETPTEPLCREGNSNDLLSKKEHTLYNPEITDQSTMANHKPQTETDCVVDDIDCIIATDSSLSLLDEITSDLGSKLKPTNFTISANNDSKGFLIQDESHAKKPTNQLTNIMDALFDMYDYGGAADAGIKPICINLEDIDINPPTITDSDATSVDFPEIRNCCKKCNNLMTECTCSSDTKNTQVDVICNGHSSLLSNDYVPLSCNSTC